jgi:hypothetical protein
MTDPTKPRGDERIVEYVRTIRYRGPELHVAGVLGRALADGVHQFGHVEIRVETEGDGSGIGVIPVPRTYRPLD